MSHLVKVKVQVKDLDALEVAAGKLGMVMNRGQATYRWYGVSVGDYPLPEGFSEEQLGKCDHALSIPGNSGAYEVGVVDHHDGNFSLLFDFWSGGYGLMEKIGKDAGKLIEEYSMAAIENECAAQGWMTQRESDGIRVFHPSGGTVVVGPGGTIDADGFSGAGCVEATRALAAALGTEQSSQFKPAYCAVVNRAKVIS